MQGVQREQSKSVIILVCEALEVTVRRGTCNSAEWQARASHMGTATGVVKMHMGCTAWCKRSANCLCIPVKTLTLKQALAGVRYWCNISMECSIFGRETSECRPL